MAPKSRTCAVCGKGGKEGCATFLSLLVRWGYFNSAEGKTNQFAHPSCVGRIQQQKRKEAR